MQFSIGTITRCTGQSHYHVPITIDGVTRVLETSVPELQAAAPLDHASAREMILGRIRSALLEANALTFAQARAALEGKAFKV